MRLRIMLCGFLLLCSLTFASRVVIVSGDNTYDLERKINAVIKNRTVISISITKENSAGALIACVTLAN